MKLIVIIFSLLVCSCTSAEKKKRDYFSVIEPNYPTSLGDQYIDDVYAQSTGRTLKRKESNASILKHLDRRRPDGSYNYEFLTDNGIHTQESSVQNGYDRVVRGSYSYIGPDGKTYSVNYIADRNGYRAYGAHLPTQPDAVANIIQQAQAGVISTTGNYVPIHTPTIAPIYNRPGVRRHPNIHASSTPAPFIINGASTTQNPYLSTVNYNEVPISSTPFAQGYDIGGFAATPAPIPVYTANTPATLINNNFELPSSTPSPFFRTTPQSGFDSRNTVYITPAPKTYVTNTYASPANYLRNDLLPPHQQFANEFNDNGNFAGHHSELDSYYGQQQHQYNHNEQQLPFELPTVQPLYNKFGNSFSSIRPSAFDRINRRY